MTDHLKENTTWHGQSREIKFRAWDVNHNVMVYPWSENKSTLSQYSNWEIVDMFEDEDIMQYTWLKDKNWKEVREGDVYRIQSYTKRHDNQCNDSILLTDFLCQVVRDNGWFTSKIIQRNVEKNDNIYREQRSKEQRAEKMSGTMSLSIYEEWRINAVVIWDIHTTPDLLSDI